MNNYGYYGNYGNYGNYLNPYSNNYMVNVQSEQEARYYPVAPQTSVTFYNEKDPQFIYKKTVGNSMEAPVFEIYKKAAPETPAPVTEYVTKEEFETFIKSMKKERNNNAKSNK